MSDKYFQERMEYLRKKFNLSDARLSLTSDPLPKDEGKTLDQVVNEFEVSQRKHTKLKVATAATNFVPEGSSKPITRLYYDFKP